MNQEFDGRKNLTLYLTNLIILLAGIYIHIPFCKQACHYCDFHFSTSQQLKSPLIKAIQSELGLQKNYLSESIGTVYLGGGTPSLLSLREIENIIVAVTKVYSLEPHAEITMEVNPDDLNKEYLNTLKKIGINRLSIGIQSFQDSVLSWMNRAHDSKQAIKSIEMALNEGFENISIDLIYGIPLPEYQLCQDLSMAIELGSPHISAYNLTIEPATLFGHQLRKGTLSEVSEEIAAEHFTSVMEILKSADYKHYEISNFAKTGYESRHNLAYWKSTPYLGVGPSAHSFDGTNRQFNVANNALYIKSIGQGKIPMELDILSPEQRINEMIMLGLRTSEGIDLSLEINDVSWSIHSQHSGYLEELLQRKLAMIDKNRLLLTDRGKLIADQIAEDLFIDAH